MLIIKHNRLLDNTESLQENHDKNSYFSLQHDILCKGSNTQIKFPLPWPAKNAVLGHKTIRLPMITWPTHKRCSNYLELDWMIKNDGNHLCLYRYKENLWTNLSSRWIWNIIRLLATVTSRLIFTSRSYLSCWASSSDWNAWKTLKTLLLWSHVTASVWLSGFTFSENFSRSRLRFPARKKKVSTLL